MVVAKARASIFGGQPVVNSYEFDENELHNGTLTFLSFDKYTEDWANFIFNHRDDTRTPPYMHDYDVVYGPIANDRVGMQVRNYREGFIGIEELLKRIEFMKGVTFQWAFCTERAIKYLKKHE